ncbi:ThiF family adenylyltransferase [Oscillibacter sp.]|uniref:ThiF family adenylyltransferase n=1 Tax=Oscillibacter sp. TaxID=1945593 RepID=UPI002897F07D|nr:ThiF family adenylyltransferase [Oscillibacter sp.]
MLIVGAGCIGASVGEILVRSGIYNLTIVDSDIFKVGNLSRHVLNLNNIGELKELSLCSYLNSLNPHANVEVINDTIIIDCTGENSVLNIFQNINLKGKHVLASISVGLGAKHLYIALTNNHIMNFNNFYELISPYLHNEKALYDDYHLPRDGTGCWHPTFSGRSDDIWIAAATSVKAIENYILSKSEKMLSLVYEQRESNGFFEGYVMVDKKEDG